MKIVIDIPKDVLKRTVFYREFRDLNDCVTTIKALEKAIPLPKCHGRLIDVNQIVYEKECVYETDGCCTTRSTPDINATPTIIEADKER